MPRPPPPECAVTVSRQAGQTPVRWLRNHLRAARPLVRPAAPLADLHVVLVGDATMSRLHRDFMGLPGPTDVLTFPIDLDPRGRPTSGEVYVCVPHARRQAKARGTRPDHEVILYAVHGMLHLCGYDDRTAPDFARMHATEDAILTRIGIGPVFAPPPEASPPPRATPAAATRPKKPRPRP